MKRLESVSGLAISQKKEWGEILSGFEGRNRYVVSDERGNELFYAVEESGSVLARLFLKAYRPFAIHVLDRSGTTLLRIERPFRFYFHTAGNLRWLRPTGWKAGKEFLGLAAALFGGVPTVASSSSICSVPSFTHGRSTSKKAEENEG